MVIFLLALAGCGQKMEATAKREALDTSPLFSDGAAARPPVPGTVSVDDVAQAVPAVLPDRVPLSMMQVGQQRFGIFCSPCHAYSGHGNGRVVQRGFPNPPDLHSAEIRALSDRQIYDVVTSGYGVMLPYGDRIAPDERWAIVSYIRALQFADAVPASDLPPELTARLEASR